MDQRTLRLVFARLCGLSNRQYSADVQETTSRVTVALYGDQPSGGFCESQGALVLRLKDALAGRPIYDAKDGARKSSG